MRRLGPEPALGHATSCGPRHAQLDGFDLDANVRVPPNDRARLEHLCRYLLRRRWPSTVCACGPTAASWSSSRPPGGTAPPHLLFDPVELLEKLAAITPRPAVNVLLYHGVLAPHARWRRNVVRYGRPAARDSEGPPPDARPRSDRTPTPPRSAWTWPALMRRVFDLDVLACPRCGGRLRVIATVQAPDAVRAILDHLERSVARDPPGPAAPGPSGDPGG